MTDTIYLVVQVEKARAGLIPNKDYYYAVPAYVSVNGTPLQIMTDDLARQLFMGDKNNWKKVIDQLPQTGCSNWIRFGDLIIPDPDPDTTPSQASVLRVAHKLSADGSFEILAELKNATSLDNAYVEIIGLNGTGWSQTGRYVMAVKRQTYNGDGYSWTKTFSGLQKSDSVEYRVYANNQVVFLSGTIVLENTDPAKGPVWGSWKPGKISLGLGYGGNLPADAATGTGDIYYRLVTGPSWLNFTENTRNYLANPTPSQLPASDVSATFSAQDQNGITEKTFVFEFVQAKMFMGLLYQVNTEKLSLGFGPNDEKPFTAKVSALYLPVNSSWTPLTQSAVHEAIGIDGTSFPWQSVFTGVRIGVYLIEGTRSNGEKGYAIWENKGVNTQALLVLSKTVPDYTPPTQGAWTPVSVGDIWELVADSDEVSGRFIEYTKADGTVVNSLKEADGPIWATLKEKLSLGGSRPFPGNVTFSRTTGYEGVTFQPDGNRVRIEAPEGSLSQNGTMGITVTYGSPPQTITVELPLINVDPSVLKPFFQVRADDVLIEVAGAKVVKMPTPWLINAPNSALICSMYNGNKYPLPAGLTFNKTTDPPQLEVTEAMKSDQFPIRFEASNAAGTAVQDILFTLKRPGSGQGKITGIWRGFDGNNLNYYIHGVLLDNNDRYKVRYKQTPFGTYNGVQSTDWSPILLTCTPGESTSGVGTYYRSWGFTGAGTNTHLEFQVWDTETNQPVGPVIAFDYTIPSSVQQPQKVFAA